MRNGVVMNSFLLCLSLDLSVNKCGGVNCHVWCGVIGGAVSVAVELLCG